MFRRQQREWAVIFEAIAGVCSLVVVSVALVLRRKNRLQLTGSHEALTGSPASD